MIEVRYTCSWCGQEKVGYRQEAFVIEDGPLKGRTSDGATSGYYSMRGGNHWYNRFRHNDSDTEVCDPCMWSDPRYVAVYGPFSPLPS